MNTKYIQTIPSSKKYEFTEEGFRLAKALLSENKSYAYISKIFEITPETLSLLCKENKIDKDNRRKYTINENFFKEINTPEQAYWLGFLDADGYVYRNKIILALQKQDESTIKKFLTSIGSNKSIKYKTVLFDGKKECHQAYVSVDSIVMVQDLAKYGCTTKKSLVLAPPTFLSKNLIPYWILGYMDGDGCVSIFLDTKTKVRRLKISFTGTKEVLEYIKQYFRNAAKIIQEHRCHNNTYRFAITETKAIEFLSKVYSDKTIYKISLDRKRNRFFEYIDYRKERNASKSIRNSAESSIS